MIDLTLATLLIFAGIVMCMVIARRREDGTTNWVCLTFGHQWRSFQRRDVCRRCKRFVINKGPMA